MSDERVYLLYDDRAARGVGTEDAIVFDCCTSDTEACEAKGEYGGMACYSYLKKKKSDGEPDELVDERFEWDWFPGRESCRLKKSRYQS